MSSKISAVLRSNKLLFISFALSIAMVVIGIFLVVIMSTETETLAPINTSAESDPSFTQSLHDTESLINHASQASAKPLGDDAQIVRGSEDWCESMMLKADAEWNDPDTRLFADKCL